MVNDGFRNYVLLLTGLDVLITESIGMCTRHCICVLHFLLGKITDETCILCAICHWLVLILPTLMAAGGIQLLKEFLLVLKTLYEMFCSVISAFLLNIIS